MADFINTGSVSVTSGSAALTFAGVDLEFAGVKAGDVVWITPASGHPASYPIASVNSATGATLAIPYKGSTASGLGYAIMRRYDEEAVADGRRLLNQNIASLNGAVAAGAAGLLYGYESSTTMANPASGKFRLNNVSFASVTQIAVSDIGGSPGAPNLAAAINDWGASSNPVKGRLVAKKAGSEAILAIYHVTALTDNAGWSLFTVSHRASAGSPLAGDEYRFEFFGAGDAGADGDFQADGSQPMTGDLDMDNNDIVDVGLINGRAPGPVTLTPVNTNAGTSAVIAGIPSWATNIRVWGAGVSLNGTGAIMLRVGRSSGLIATGYDCALAGVVQGNAPSFAKFTDGAYAGGGAAARLGHFLFDLVKTSGDVWKMSGITYVDDASTAQVWAVHANIDVGGTLDRFGVVAVSGAFDAGSIGGYYW